jgi:hypothetical protein
MCTICSEWAVSSGVCTITSLLTNSDGATYMGDTVLMTPADDEIVTRIALGGVGGGGGRTRTMPLTLPAEGFLNSVLFFK